MNGLDSLLAAYGYSVIVDNGAYRAAVRPDGVPLCLGLVYDWPAPVLTVTAGRPRVFDPDGVLSDSNGPVEAAVVRPSDMSVIGVAVVSDRKVIRLEAPVRGWALLDVVDGVKRTQQLLSMLGSLRPRLVYLVAAFSSRQSLRSLWLQSPGVPLVVGGFRKASEVASAWPGLSIIVNSWGDTKGVSAEEAERRLLSLTGRGC